MKQGKHKHQKKLRRHAFSSLAYFVLAVLALNGSVFAWERAAADEDITVSARVGMITSGPTTVEEDEDEDDDNANESTEILPLAPLPTAPVVSLEPFSDQILIDRVKKNTRFLTEYPGFRGMTNISNALITLIFDSGGFRLRIGTTAGADGIWTWKTPEPFPNGEYTLRVMAEEADIQNIRADRPFHFTVASSRKLPSWGERYKEYSSLKGLFDLRLSILPQYRTVAPGEKIVAQIRLRKLAGLGTLKPKVEYLIRNAAGETLLTDNEEISLTEEISYLKTFYTQATLDPGQYELVVKVPSQNALAIGVYPFTLAGKPTVPFVSGTIDYTVIFQALLASLFLFTILSYFEFTRFLSLRKRIHLVGNKNLKPFF